MGEALLELPWKVRLVIKRLCITDNEQLSGDVSLSAEDTPPVASKPTYGYSASPVASTSTQTSPEPTLEPEGEHYDQAEYEDEAHHNWFLESTAVRYLLAGGVAGAVSRTCTAPFDRLKIFLITRPPDPTVPAQLRGLGMKSITSAIANIYAQNGVLGFWIGNGLSVAKILPESAIKFMSYESSVRSVAFIVDIYLLMNGCAETIPGKILGSCRRFEGYQSDE